MLKMYIAVLDEVPDHMVPVLVAHATLGAHLEFCGDKDTQYKEWLEGSFRKVVIKVNRREFEQIRTLPNVYLAHESSVLGGENTCAVVCPRDKNPRVLVSAKMWTASDTTVANKLFVKVARLEKQVSDYGWQQDQSSHHRMGL